jgi:hypothetical protein
MNGTDRIDFIGRLHGRLMTGCKEINPILDK